MTAQLLPGEVRIVGNPSIRTIGYLCDADLTTIAQGKVADGSCSWLDEYAAGRRAEYDLKRSSHPRKGGRSGGETAYRHQAE